MLHRSLSEHIAECFYGDDKLADQLWLIMESHSQPYYDQINDINRDFYHLLIDAVDARYPREHRLTDIRNFSDIFCIKDLFLCNTLPALDELYNKLLFRNGDLITYKESQVTAYVRLAAGLDPTLLVSWQLVQWIDKTTNHTDHEVTRVVAAQTPFFAPLGHPALPFAEGHVHWGGVTADTIILDNFLLSNSSKKLNLKNHWHKNQSNNINSWRLRARELLLTLLQLESDNKLAYQSFNNPMETRHNMPDWMLLSEINNTNKIGSPRWLLRKFAEAMHHKHVNRWLWLNTYLCALYREEVTSPLIRARILCLWQTINCLRRSLIMDGQGLTIFAERYYNSVIDRTKDTTHTVHRLWSGSEDVAETKGMPNAFNPEFVKKLSNELIKKNRLSHVYPPYIFGEHEISFNENSAPIINALEKWQFCGHFSRSGVHNSKKRIKPKSKEIWEQANTLIKNLEKQSQWNLPEFFGGQLNQNFSFHPYRWFRGLDVAGDENDLKIEWFAPVLRWLRVGFSPKHAEALPSTSFHFSIHAGEDYAHPASGLRHIDETVKFCGMHEGDRLGHALALGIEPEQWAERQGEIILPLDKHLDNLVWLWHYATLLSCHLPLAQQVLPMIERRIKRFWRLCPWWQVLEQINSVSLGNNNADFDASILKNVSPDDLFNAWLLRRNCYHTWTKVSSVTTNSATNKESTFINNNPTLLAKDITALPDFDLLNNKNSIAAQVYLARHQWLASDFEESLVIIKVCHEHTPNNSLDQLEKKSLIEDYESQAELRFMSALQDYLLSEYDKLGLIIETNPTSNVYIARLKSHSEHPIFRWNPPDESALDSGGKANLYGLRKGPVRVLINTDDPGIMPTTLRTEFLLLREAAIELGIGRTVAERWLEGIRQYGIEQFSRNHQRVFERNKL